MIKAMRTTMRAALAALPLLAAGMVDSSPAWAEEPQDVFEGAPGTSEPEQKTPPPPMPAPMQAPMPAPMPGPMPVPPQGVVPYPRPLVPFAAPQAPNPGMVPAPVGDPNTRRSKHRVTEDVQSESEGPVISWDPLRFAVALEGRGVWLTDRGARRLAGERRPLSGGLSLQGDALRLGDKLAVRLDLAWVMSTHTSYLSDSQASERLETNLFSLGLSVRYHVLRWLAPYARLSGGAGWDKLSVSDMNDRQRFGHGAAGAGVFLRSPGLCPWQQSAFPFVGLVGHIEAGYSMASGSDFVLDSSPAPGSTTPIPTSPVALGHASRSAPYLRVSLGLAF